MRCVSAVSRSDVEQLFSRAGYIFSPKRTNLKPRTLQYLTTMHYWYKTEDCDESNTQRAAASEARALKFASLSIDRVVMLKIVRVKLTTSSL